MFVKTLFSRSVAAVAVLVCINSVHASYNNCSTPPVVGIGAKPNVMIVMDYSGSMQFPAYVPGNFGSYYPSHVADCDSRDGRPAFEQFKSYDPLIGYYGYFDSDSYYVYNKSDSKNPYFEPASNPPPKPVKFTARSSKANQGIWFTAAGHEFQPGDTVALFNLTSHVNMNAGNGRAFKVEEVSGDRFRVNYQWNGIPDQDTGSAVKRVTGRIQSGLSGNILNFAAMSRMDVSLKALIGGKAECTSENCYLRAQGSKRYFRENSTLEAGFYARPGTLENPDNFDTGDYNSKDVFLSIEPSVKGKLDDRDPSSTGRSQDGLPTARAEVWYFKLDEPRKVTIKLESASFQPSLYLFQGQRPGSPYITKGVQSPTSGKAEISASLNPGLYSIEATSGNVGQGDYAILANVDLQFDASPSHNGTKAKMDALADARVRLKIPKSARNGAVQDNFDKVRFGFMYYKGEQDNDNGRILIGCENDDRNRLIDAVQGISGNASNVPAIYPYGSSPTGPALSEAYGYFTQSQSKINSDFTSRGTSKDPY